MSTGTLSTVKHRLTVGGATVHTLSGGVQGPPGQDNLANRLAAEAAAEQTAADRFQTGLDRTATGEDRQATAADRVATGEDREATAADRVQTGLDRMATGEDRQATAADRVATGEDAQATAADRVQTGQDRVATGEDRAQTGLDRAQIALDVQATAADRVQTGQDVGNTAASRTAAEMARDAAAQFLAACQSALSQSAGYFANLLALFGSAAAIVTAQSAAAASADQANVKAGEAQAWARSAASVAQQDLSGTIASALHRSPNWVTSLFVYDAANDSDAGRWIERLQNAAWMQEALNGMWLPHPDANGWPNELSARCHGASTGPELVSDPGFDSAAAWTLGGSFTSSIKGGRLTASAGAPVTSGNTIVVNAGGNLIAANKVYMAVYTISAIEGQASINGGGVNNLPIRSVPGTYVDFLPATVNTTLGFIARGSGLTSIAIESVSLKEVTAFNTASGSYYQLASDGKFYRLNRNLLQNGDTPFNDGRAATVRNGVSLYTATGVSSTAAYYSWFGAGLNGNGGQINVVAGVQYVISFYAEQGTHTGTVNVSLIDAGGAGLSTAANGIALPVAGAGGLTRITATVTATASSTTGQMRINGVASGATILVGAVSVTYALDANANVYEARGATGNNQVEVLRGNAAKFPKQAGIVAEASRVVIYDLTQPGRPMWMVFTTSAQVNRALGWLNNGNVSINSVFMLNGELCMAVQSVTMTDTGGLYRVNFIKDTLEKRGAGNMTITFPQATIAQRNVPLMGTPVSSGSISSYHANVVAMTVLPNAPIDPLTLLPVPTIGVAVGTGSAGLLGAVLMNDGTVVSYSQPANDGQGVAFTKRGEIMWGYGSSSGFTPVPLQTSNVANVQTLASNLGRLYGNVTVPAVLTGSKRSMVSAGNVYALPVNNVNQLVLMRENPSNGAAGAVAHITGNYSTGWMFGDIRRTLVSDNYAGTLVSGNVVNNGDMSGGTTGWQNYPASTNALTVVGGALHVESSGASDGSARLFLDHPNTPRFTVGKAYMVTFTVVAASSAALQFLVNVDQNLNVVGGSTSVATGLGPGTYTYFTPTITSAYSGFKFPGAGNFFEIDNVTAREYVPDRSVKNKGAVVNGTLVMTPVAAGAQLTCAGGFTNDPVPTGVYLGPELVTNGKFDVDTSGWTAGASSTLTLSGANQLVITNAAASTAMASQLIPTRAGGRYRVTFDRANASVGAVHRVSVNSGGAIYTGDLAALTFNGAFTTYSFEFTAIDADSTLTLITNSAQAGVWTTWDNISVREVGANNQLVYNGTFDVDLSGWVATYTPAQGASTITWSGGVAVITPDGTNRAYLSSPVVTVAGRKYRATFTIPTGGAVNVQAGTTTTGGIIVNAGSFSASATPQSFEFTATGALTYLTFQKIAANATTVDNVSVVPADALGSTANVLQEPSHPFDLDFGTGSWMLAPWFNVPSTTFGPANFVLNSAAAGAAIGTFPTGWGFTGAGLTGSVVGTGTTNEGYPYIDVQVSGTSTAGFFNIRFGSIGNGMPVVFGSVLTHSVMLGLINGSFSNVTSVGIESPVSNSSQSYLGSKSTTVPGGSITSTPQRFSGTVTTDLSGAFSVQPSLAFGCNTTGPVSFTLRIAAPQWTRGSAPQTYYPTSGAAYNGIAPVMDYSGPNGAYWRAGIDGDGKWAVELYDGTTTRRLASTVAINDGAWHRGQFHYVPANTQSQYVLGLDGEVNAVTSAAAMGSLTNANALLTIGNDFALQSAFPGSIALARVSAAVPTSDMTRWMYVQERGMFQPGAQSTLADVGGILGVDYDRLEDKIKVLTPTNDASFIGLVRTQNTPVLSGTYGKVAMESGWKLVSRGTTNPGVDVSVRALNLREELGRREESVRLARLVQELDYAGGFTATYSTGFTVLGTMSASALPGGGMFPAGVTVEGAQISGAGIAANTAILTVQNSGSAISDTVFTGAGTGAAVSFKDFILPVGYEIVAVNVDGVKQQEGSSKAWTRRFDGFRESVRFGTAPGNTKWVNIQARRAA